MPMLISKGQAPFACEANVRFPPKSVLRGTPAEGSFGDSPHNSIGSAWCAAEGEHRLER